MSATNQFTGLPMPVFTAFGWAGEETAIKFALEQLELFIQQLHAGLSKGAREMKPRAFIWLLTRIVRKTFTSHFLPGR